MRVCESTTELEPLVDRYYTNSDKKQVPHATVDMNYNFTKTCKVSLPITDPSILM